MVWSPPRRRGTEKKFAPPFGEVEVPLLDDVADEQLAELLERSCRPRRRAAAIAWLWSHPDVAALLSEALETEEALGRGRPS